MKLTKQEIILTSSALFYYKLELERRLKRMDNGKAKDGVKVKLAEINILFRFVRDGLT